MSVANLDHWQAGPVLVAKVRVFFLKNFSPWQKIKESENRGKDYANSHQIEHS
jgi:hypothetical protein